MSETNTIKSSRHQRVAKLSAVAAAGGASAALAQAAGAANLLTDLVVNGDFEDVTSPTGIGATVASGWEKASAASVFAYNYSVGYDDRDGSNTVPPGNVATSSTDYYFTLNGGDDFPVFQDIDLSGGASASAIASGNATFDIRGYFTNYLNDLEGGQLRLQFFDGNPTGGGGSAGADVSYVDSNLDEWTEIGGTGSIPVSTQWVRVWLEKDPGTGQSAGPDVYADNISFQVIPEPSGLTLGLVGFLVLMLRRRRRRS